MLDRMVLKSQLLAKRDELNGRVGRLKESMTQKSSADWSEQAQERENDEVKDALGNEAIHELGKINKALAKMAEGEYGYCAFCGDEIGEERLLIMPYADLCIRCAETRDVR